MIFKKTVYNNTRIKYSFLGITILKIKADYSSTKVYFLGVKILKIKTPLTSKKIQKVHSKSFKKYQGYLKGKEVVLVATGPSLKQFNPIPNAVYVGVNKAFTSEKVRLDFSFVQDYAVGEENLLNLEKYAAKNRTKLFYGDIGGGHRIPYIDAIRSNVAYYYTDAFSEPNFKLSHQIDKEPLGDFNTVVFSAMQFILWCQPQKVYLVGCDCSLGGYFNSKEKNSFVVPTEEIVNRWKNLREFAKKYYPTTEIISVNPVGLKGLFKEINQA